VSQMCVTIKPRRNEEAQAHIRLSSHTKKQYIYTTSSPSFLSKRKQLHLPEPIVDDSGGRALYGVCQRPFMGGIADLNPAEGMDVRL
jgi:hypothetical protein